MIPLLLYLVAGSLIVELLVQWSMENLEDLHLKERCEDFMIQEILLVGRSTPEECPYLTAAKKEVEQICS